MPSIPAPGSAAALHQGCRCPIHENRSGRGARQGADGSPLEFTTTDNCPLHGDWYLQCSPLEGNAQ